MELFSSIRVRKADPSDKVYKDECSYSFASPESDEGLFVSLNSFLGFSKKFAYQYMESSGNRAFLHIKRIRIRLDTGDSEPQAPKRLAIGLEGGFQTDEKYRLEEHVQIVVLPEELTFQLDDSQLPSAVRESAESLIAAEGAFRNEELNAATGTWDGEARITSKHSETLLQLDNGIKIPPSGWKCSRCDLRENLWLNLTDGAINCGRKFFDGSGGNNHAIDHYHEARYPLAVKLGTINYKGADVYSYDEDDMVLDSQLEKHLGHFGIDVAAMQKTEKSMAELELDMNQRIGEWAICTEEDCQLQPLAGPGFTGLQNLGNSCYMNSIMQMLFALPSFRQKYFDRYGWIVTDHMKRCSSNDPNTNLTVQMAKLASGILSGEYSLTPGPGNSAGASKVQDGVDDANLGIKPQCFKLVVGKNHPEFSTKRQQDAEEFLRHLLDMLEKNERSESNVNTISPAGKVFAFNLEERIECEQTKKVAYKIRSDVVLGLTVPMEEATNRADVKAYEAKSKAAEERGEKLDTHKEPIVRANIALSTCLSAFSQPEYIEDFYSSAARAKVIAKKTTKFLSFPDFLIVQIKKFTLAENWTPKKLDISLDVPDELDLSELRSRGGLQPGEEEMPSDDGSENNTVQLDQAVIDQLVGMGFPVDGCKKAVYNTNNQGVEAAMQWVMDHMGDSDFGDPFVVPNSRGSGNGGGFVANEEAVQTVLGLGFRRDQATRALRETQNNVERAIDWIFSHHDEINAPSQEEPQGATVDDDSAVTDGSGKYKLVGFVTHMGSSVSSGHYVCHLLKERHGWVIFNDEKVAVSEKPPKDLAYLYLFERMQ